MAANWVLVVTGRGLGLRLGVRKWRERDGRAGVMGSSRDGDQSEASVSLSDQSEAWADIEA